MAMLLVFFSRRWCTVSSPLEMPFDFQTSVAPGPPYLIAALLIAISAIRPTGAEEAAPSGLRVSRGDWGVIESHPVTLEPPASHLWSALYDERSVWNFAERSQDEARKVMAEIGFAESLLALIDREGTWTRTDQGLELDLTDPVIEAMTPENRAALARWFRLNHIDFFSKLIINLEGGDFSAYLSNGVAPRTLDLVKRMTFARRNVLSMMDRAYILRQLGDDRDEKERFLRATFATRSLVVRLVVSDDSDLDQMIRYWSAGGANPGIASLLRGVHSTSGVDKIDLVQILPPVPRRYLNSFTNLRDVRPNSTPDCFWTSVQFFDRKASPRLLDPLTFSHHLDGVFEKVDDEAGFGDIVCMFDGTDDSFLHSFVQIADDIVFTKNGSSFARPFVLTRKSDMLSVYLDETPYRFDVYRRVKRS